MKRLKVLKSEIIDKLYWNYGLRVRNLTLLTGFYDINYKIETDSQVYFLKIYGKDKMPAVNFQVSYMEFLLNNKFPIAKILTNKNHKKVIKISGKPAVLQKWINGKHLREAGVSPHKALLLGRLMGKMHKAVSGKKIKGVTTRKYFWDLSQFDLAVKSFNRAKKFIKKESLPLVKKILVEYSIEKQNLQLLRKGYIHNDFHDNNVLISGNKISGIVDFGDALESWYMADLSIPMEHVFFPKNNFKLLIKAFIRGYKAEFYLPKLDWSYLALLVKMRAVMLIIGIPLELGGNPDKLYKRFFINTFKTLKYLSNEENVIKFNRLINKS